MFKIRDCATKLAPAKPEGSSGPPKPAEVKPSGPAIKKPETVSLLYFANLNSKVIPQ